jgi:hypothetical protein
MYHSLCCLFLMLQAALLSYHFLHIRSFPQSGFVSPEVEIGTRDVIQAPVVALFVVVVGERVLSDKCEPDPVRCHTSEPMLNKVDPTREEQQGG